MVDICCLTLTAFAKKGKEKREKGRKKKSEKKKVRKEKREERAHACLHIPNRQAAKVYSSKHSTMEDVNILLVCWYDGGKGEKGIL